jgi:hypothetical protein
LPERVEVTRRSHPLFGRDLEVIRANKLVLTIRLHDVYTLAGSRRPRRNRKGRPS